jgi:hypothetical protein
VSAPAGECIAGQWLRIRFDQFWPQQLVQVTRLAISTHFQLRWKNSKNENNLANGQKELEYDQIIGWLFNGSLLLINIFEIK